MLVAGVVRTLRISALPPPVPHPPGGRGPDKTILTFKGQTAGGQGIEATGNNFTLEGLAVEDTAGNAVKVLGARNVTRSNLS